MDEQNRDDRLLVVCRLCGKEVPRSAAQTAEGRDYTYYFCGPGCYQQWSQGQQARRDAERSD